MGCEFKMLSDSPVTVLRARICCGNCLNESVASRGALNFHHHTAVDRLCTLGDIPSQSCSAEGDLRGL